jgi:3D (Asp-Asp-Asp) domain-containing protein
MKPPFKFLILIFVFLIVFFLDFSSEAENLPDFSFENKNFILYQGDTISPILNLNPPRKIIKVLGLITGYSSTPQETDDTPFLTASGKKVRDGIIANNFFPFGTKIKIPKVFGDKIFVVEDRMKRGKSKYHFDVWFKTSLEAKNFGARIALVEIIFE